MAKESVRELLRARVGDSPRINLIDLDTAATPGMEKEKKALKQLEKHHERLFELQERLWAEQKRSILIAIQAMDTGGKDGVVKHVIAGLNPTGVDIHAFKAPTEEEKRHNFLWRFKRVLPPTGCISIFNRTYYEDVLVAKVKHLATEETIQRRYGEINRFEQQLVKSGTTLVKLFLHISYEEQRRRLLERLENPLKRWKFSENDINERAFWDDYTSAYDAALTRCNSRLAPWYIVPADNKWYRDWAVEQILIETLEELNPQYPMPKLDVKALEQRLEA